MFPLWVMVRSQELTMTQALEQVQVTTNNAALLKSLRFAFTNHDTVVTELMQNARRAGAKSVRIAYSKETQILTITDDGHGIQDWHKLLQLGTSDWDQNIMETEGPYGLGFMSALYAARDIEIWSNGRYLLAPTEMLLQGRKVNLCEAAHDGQTVISLQGFDWKNPDRQIERMASGFAIPVFYQDKELPRPHATRADDVVIDIGALRLGERFDPTIVLYLQGFEIGRINLWYATRVPSDVNVVHLDPAVFKGRLPDRDKLIDEQAAHKQIEKAVREEWVRHLQREKAALSPRVFLLKHFFSVLDANALELLNDIDCLPVEAFTMLDRGIPTTLNDSYEKRHRRAPSLSGHMIERADVVEGRVKIALFDTTRYDCDAEPSKQNHWLLASCSEAAMLEMRLDEQHWVHTYAQIDDDDDTEVAVRIHDTLFDGQVSTDGDQVWGARVILAKSASLAMTVKGDDGVEITDIADKAFVADFDGERALVFLVDSRDGKLGSIGPYLMSQLASYEDNNDLLYDEAYADAGLMSNAIAVATTEDIAKRVEVLLASYGFGQGQTWLEGKTLTLKVTDGVAKVISIEG